MASQESNEPAAISMFESAQTLFPERLRHDKWYLTVLAALLASGKPKVIGTLYSYLLTKPEYSTSVQRQHLVRRMRGALVRCCLLNGLPITMDAVGSIAAVEREEDKDYSFVRENCQITEATSARAESHVELLQGSDIVALKQAFRAHKDIAFMIIDIGYGLGFSEDRELDKLETELVILPVVELDNLIFGLSGLA